MTAKKKKPEMLYWTWEDEADDNEAKPAGPFLSVEEILAVAARCADIHLHAFAVRPGGPLVAKVLIGKVETMPPSAKQVTMGMAERVADLLCEELGDVDCTRYELKGTAKQQQQNLKQLKELLASWCPSCMISSVPRLVNPETHVVPFNLMAHRTLKLKRWLRDMDLSQPVMPEVQPALDALRKALDAYKPK